MVETNINESSGPSFWAYLWTGMKVFIVSAVLGGIYYLFDLLMNLMFKQGLFTLLIQLFKKSCEAGVCNAVLPTFTMIIVSLFGLIWLILSLYIGGVLCRNLWKWS